MATEALEVKRLVKQLQNTSNEADVLKILEMLKSDVKVSESVLRESKAGLAVGKLRTNASKAVADAAKDLVKKWKSEVEAAKAKAPPKAAASAGKPVATAAAVSTASVKSPVVESTVRSSKTDGADTNITGDKARDKCVELIYNALAAGSGAPMDLILKRATIIEKTAHGAFDAATYRHKIRQLYTNFMDKKNPGLRESVVNGDIPTESVATMSSADMASAEQKAERARIEAENLFATLGAGDPQAETDAFQCGRCKQRKCRYRQAQTRSADEPMTTFVTCVNCNNRWKFS